MRLFVALELNNKVVASLAEMIRRLRPVAPMRWVPPQNLHLTLKFIGEWPEERVDRVVGALQEISFTGPLTVPLAGLGFFPSAQRPRVLWVGAENTSALRRLASQVDSALQPLGIAPEVRPYQPHLTLGRLRDNEPLGELHRVIDDLPSREFGIISPDRFVLFGSTLTPTGAVHHRVAEFPFAMPEEETPAASGRTVYASRA